jgi:UDP-N-acetylmuramyl pentapeptide phosphotransferase/UDP-N-acetylglucosamine-1-phosphate transferase
MITFLVFYFVVFIACFIVFSIIDAIFKIYPENKLIGRLIGAVILMVVLAVSIGNYHKNQSLLKIENHGVRWVLDPNGSSEFSISSELVLFITEDGQLHLLSEKDFQAIRFDSNKTNRIVSYEKAVKIY